MKSRAPAYMTKIVPGNLMKMSAYDLLKAGYDTADIAFAKALPESTICNWQSAEREKRHRAELIASRHGMN